MKPERIYLYIPLEYKLRLAWNAEKNHHSINSEVKNALAAWLSNNKRQPPQDWLTRMLGGATQLERNSYDED